MKIDIRIIILILIILILISLRINTFRDGLTTKDGQPVFAILKDKQCLDSDTLTMVPCNTINTQQWYTYPSNKHNKIASFSSGQCLTTIMNNETFVYDLSMNPCTESVSQEWLLPPTNSIFQNNYTGGNCLDISSNKLYMSNNTCTDGDSGRSWTLHTFK
jgi:hypothetical protein